MKKIFLTLAVASMVLSAAAQKTITIKGKVQFTDKPDFAVKVIERNGFEKKTLAETVVAKDGTYSLTMNVVNPGAYTLDCGQWQSVQIWAEDENLEVDFRGYDTAKMKIKNPPYVYINGGKNNELMNLYNFDIYRNYQLMIGVSQAAYRAKLEDKASQDLSSSLYDVVGDDNAARSRFLAEKYADRNSVLAILPRLNAKQDAAIIAKIISTLEAKNPNYAPLVKYKKNAAEAKAQEERLAMGQKAPEFSFPTPDGKKNLGTKDFKGKFLIVDFWASWCGPCRGEVPNMKKIYADYKDKGVEFLGVSIDSKDADWKKALAEEEMPWPQVCAPGSGKDIMKEYQFSGIPYIILLDKEGNIIAKNLRGEKMREAIENAVSGKLTAPKPKKSIGAMGMM